jgi:hypothetical protein
VLNRFYRTSVVVAALASLPCAPEVGAQEPAGSQKTTSAAHANADGLQCRPAGALARVKELSEASGIAASRRNPGSFWALNDSGQPVVYALDAQGAVAGRVRLTGAMVEDWEAIVVGPCANGSCLYVGDIGDNGGSRRAITIYRLAEPAPADASATPDIIHATYPDRPQDAESLLATSDGSLYLVTKGENGTVALYRFPRDLRAGATVMLERVAKPREPGKSPDSQRVTDAAASPMGDWIVLRTNRSLTFHRTKELLGGNWQPAHVVDLTGLDEPQGEGVTFGTDGTIVVTGEGGGKSAAGTIGRLSCTALR